MDKPAAIWVTGTMSGTSLDGVDAAQIRTDGEQIFEFGPATYRKYSDKEQDILHAALGKWPGALEVKQAAKVVEDVHLKLLKTLKGAQMVGFHGQTLAHDPCNGRTHQAGDGARLAKVLKLPVVWDFRRADVEMGGQGAPLAPFYHFACAKWMKAEAPVAFLNLGGVGNLTYVDPRCSAPDDTGALLAFDTGPANAPINDLMQARLKKPYDRGGQLAATGKVAEQVVRDFMSDPYFFRQPPKSLDRDAFPQLSRAITNLTTADAAATLVACVVVSISKAMLHLPAPVEAFYVCRGGRHNPLIMAGLRAALACTVVDIDDTGLNGDMLEAQAFAFLAMRVARGLTTSCPSTTGVAAGIGGGRRSLP